MTFFRYSSLLTIGIWIAWIDQRTRKIPNLLLCIMTIATLFSYGLHRDQFVPALGCALVAALFTLSLAMIRSQTLGAGDSKLIAVLALLLGRGSRLISDLIFATCVGAVQILVLLVIHKKLPRNIAFAPALIMGAFLSI